MDIIIFWTYMFFVLIGISFIILSEYIMLTVVFDKKESKSERIQTGLIFVIVLIPLILCFIQIYDLFY